MRWTGTLIPTLREDPQEAEIPSHKLMLRAGLIRRLAGGLYTFLPLGFRALRKVEQIVREEMDRAGALEVLMPALQPREIWDCSGRYEVMGSAMFKVTDRLNHELVLGPTHEEVITRLAAGELMSYRQFPKTFYQIQTKFRDEIRPRFGLMRAKEFIMKDAYSFDVGWDQADASYQAMYDAYTRIFQRCGLRTRVVEADTGAMGGKWSHEFMVLADSGEDGIVECDSCAYAANLERAERTVPQGKDPDPKPTDAGKGAPKEMATPDCRTIEEVSAFLKCKPRKLIKTLIYLADGEPICALVPGDRDINEQKLARAIGAASMDLADDETITAVTGAPVGFAGPSGLSVPVYADVSLRGASGVVTGANKADTHLVGFNLARDATVMAFHDLCIARQGDICPHCPGKLQQKRGIEVGHVFKLGTKYSESFGACYLDDNGSRHPAVMGCYGIGVTRTLQAVVEQCRDDNGIIWPVSIAPYPVVVLLLNPDDTRSNEVADALVNRIEARGIDVLVDDRDDRPGVKFKDADLLGFPLRVVISDRSLANGNVEIKPRQQKEPGLVPIQRAADRIVELCNADKGGRDND